jgi:hypothetical protein
MSVPIAAKPFPLPERNYPITMRENLMLALDHQVPVWIPNFYGSGQMFYSFIANDSPINKQADAVDWFGVEYKYSKAQGSNTPMGNVLNEITEWEKKLHWEDMTQYDWESDAKRLTRDGSKALYMRMSNGFFERLHMLEGFEQALMDVLLEPEAVHDFMMRYCDFKIELFGHMRKHLQFDFIVAADDWGTARAPFFSVETLEKTALEPTKKFVKAVQATGTKFVQHCCGVINPFIPYLVDEIGVDGLELQTNLNDLPWILESFGDRVTVEFSGKTQLLYDPGATENDVRAHAREIVDAYGAGAVPGSGVVVNAAAGREDIFRAYEDELYEYSLKKYAELSGF